MTKENNNLIGVYEHLLEMNLSGAMDEMQTFLSVRPNSEVIDSLNAIRTDFQLMADYWKKGYKDPQGNALYQNLLRRMYGLYVYESLAFEIGGSPFQTYIYERVLPVVNSMSFTELQLLLENFVSDVAMLELEPEYNRSEKSKVIYQKHHDLMRDWFDYMWLSPVWNMNQARELEKLLLSPTVDSNDQQLLISGMTIALVNHFDMSKFRVLLSVYKQSADVAVRQRALVGWVFAMSDEILPVLYHDEVREIEALLEQEGVCEELAELQRQVYLCMNAEKDNLTIQKEILPELINNSNYRVTRNGIEEMDEDQLEDILDPGAEDRRMEKLEENYRRMQDMQKQGSDIYFGGFSQMKRFQFFKDAINWFVPFYLEHPGISEVVDRFRSNRFMKAMIKIGPFCNSDKYSFLLAFSQVLSKMPKDVMDMFEAGEASIDEYVSKEMQSTAFVRRSYLQDLYRFYRLFSFREQFRNPFEQDVALFFANPIFSHTHIEPHFEDFALSLMKQNRIDEAIAVLDNVGEARRGLRYYLMAGQLAFKYGNVFSFSDTPDVYCFEKALELEPKNEKANNGMAKIAFRKCAYDEALKYYGLLMEINPEKRIYVLNHAVCLTKLLRYTEALKELYQLNYERPDDKKVIKVLAWTLTCDGKYEQATGLYQQLLSEDVQMEDLLNYGYCLWFSGRVSDAADCFHRYIETTGENKSVILDNERALLREKGITLAEQQMMLYTL